ncbi:hypothetical protein FOXG_18238 [Fusarium oxysporum f. sp. lycopersici 4287]|uniref:Uncharacterized protein n=2 Tax=Fusarium oxysporum TaxID=5507 RepID=A0A0J9UDI4_FUSO4|nr:hypothetical protein FOXG_18238 [Fusarium oxysporum f. sp. lycopersici 4287]EXK41566.1 hypothetical protein FOMG_04935 [Fusarium oxysporum f. sp. melonis 26406]KNA97423.1 hypothetical protein FOXG_18238 [Fusarium oxysporum f. sp. lycopersici 4287]
MYRCLQGVLRHGLLHHLTSRLEPLLHCNPRLIYEYFFYFFLSLGYSRFKYVSYSRCLISIFLRPAMQLIPVPVNNYLNPTLELVNRWTSWRFSYLQWVLHSYFLYKRRQGTSLNSK